MLEDVGKYQKNIKIGLLVGIITRENRDQIFKGYVKNILTRSEFHSHGIMVELEDGKIGRVIEIFSTSVHQENENSLIDRTCQSAIKDVDEVAVPKSISIAEDEQGHSFRTLFYPYLIGSKKIILADPYIRKDYQIKNLSFFCTMLFEMELMVNFHLITKSENKFEEENQREKLEELVSSLSETNINFTYEFDEKVHDRSVMTDTGWKIILGRGLDIFKDPGSYYSPANYDLTKRKCKMTTITFVKTDNGVY